MNRFKFYRSKEWNRLRDIIISERINENGDSICEGCGKAIVNRYDLILHHVDELTEGNVSDTDISLNPENLQILCRDCHNRAHERFGHNKASSKREVFVVWGSPCAGKRAYVDSIALKDDLIIDIDRLYEAMNNDRSNAVKGNVMQVYRTLIDMVKCRSGKWHDAYIVRTLPLEIDRELIVKECGGAELIHIDTDKETCEAEARKRGGQWPDWVKQYWEYYTPPPSD